MKYNALYLDPAWEQNARNNPNTKFGGGAPGYYQTMPVFDRNDKKGNLIKGVSSLPIADLADDNCALCMWCTFPQLEEQIKLFKHWGFDYKTVLFTWIKTNKNNNKPFFGVGYYAKSNAEVCLLGIKGKMKPVSNKVSSVIISPRREHSRKPDEARERIVKLFGDVPRLEMFARCKADGWDVWGNETDKFIA